MPFEFKTKPFKHQLDEFTDHGQDFIRAILWEQGTGKSKEIIDQAAFLFLAGKIDCLFIVAPPGLPENWVVHELTTHMPVDYSAVFYQTKKASGKRYQRHLSYMIEKPGMLVIAMSFNSLTTPKGRNFAREVLSSRRCYYAVDECHNIKTPTAKRTELVLSSGELAQYRRIAGGTPVTQGPFDLYSQYRFLEPNFWHKVGCRNFYAFKTRFGVWRKGIRHVKVEQPDGTFLTQEKTYPDCVSYKDMDTIERLTAPYRSRVLKEDIDEIDLPPKLYTYRFFDLADDQRRAYETLKSEMMLQVADGICTAPMAIVMLLRLQQISCGYLPLDDDGEDAPLHRFAGKNPRIELLKEIMEETPNKVIIWARFRHDIEQIKEVLKERCVTYYGAMDAESRSQAKHLFKTSDSVQAIVATPATLGEGHTLTEARTVIYYNNDFNLKNRLQSEDRAHRIGQVNKVLYIDIVGHDTVDRRIASSLKEKFKIAAELNGDRLRDWMQKV